MCEPRTDEKTPSCSNCGYAITIWNEACPECRQYQHPPVPIIIPEGKDQICFKIIALRGSEPFIFKQCPRCGECRLEAVWKRKLRHSLRCDIRCLGDDCGFYASMVGCPKDFPIEEIWGRAVRRWNLAVKDQQSHLRSKPPKGKKRSM